MSVVRLDDYRPSRSNYRVYLRGAYHGTVEDASSEHDAAQTAAWLLFDRAEARKASMGVIVVYIAYGKRREDGEGSEIRFTLKKERKL